MPVKKGLCIGINYEKTDHQLNGCLNDASDWGDLLVANGFTVSKLLEQEATKKNIISCISNLIGTLNKGDVGVISYSGHGTWIPDRDGDERDGRDEAICPIDMGTDGNNLIIGPEFKQLFDHIVPGSHVVFITDSCFSGSVYRFFNSTTGLRKVRFMPPSHFLTDEKLIRRMDFGFGQSRSNIKINSIKLPLQGLVHFSGCGDNEYSNDAQIDGRFSGAMSYFAIKAFIDVLKVKGTYLDAWKLIRKRLPNWEFQQAPRINAFLDLKNSHIFG